MPWCRSIRNQVESVAQHARMFEHKPDGQVTLFNTRDGKGVPIVPMQDPLHYPHGTGFLMPGVSILTAPSAPMHQVL